MVSGGITVLMNALTYLLLLFISLIISIVIPLIGIVQTVTTAESVSIGELQSGIFILLAIMSTVAFVFTYRG